MVYNNALILFELVFYGIVILPLCYNLWAHGKYGALGWFFFINFCLLRLVGNGLLKSGNPNNVEPGSIVSQVALSPLFFAIFGIIHESTISVRDRHPFLFGWGMQALGHFFVLGALGVTLAGATNITKPNVTADQMEKDIHLIRAGSLIFLAIYILIGILAWISARCKNRLRGERTLSIYILISMPFLLLRILYPIIGAYVNTTSWNFLHGGTLAEETVMQIVPECFITIAIVVAGLLTRRLPDERKAEANGV